MSTVAVISHLWLGHIPTYHRLLIERLTLAGHRVLSLAPCSMDDLGGAWDRSRFIHAKFGSSPEEMIAAAQPAVCKPLGRRLLDATGVRKLLRATGLPAAWRAARLWRRTAQALVEQEDRIGWKTDLVILVYPIEGYYAACLPAGVVPRLLLRPWVGIWTGVPGGRAKRRPNVPSWNWILRAGNSRALVVDPGIWESLAASNPGLPVFAIPELADLRPPQADHPCVQRLMELAAGRRIVGLLGNITRRKGIFPFLEMAALAHARAMPLFFVAAGDFSLNSCGKEYGAIAAACAGAPENFLLFPERIADGPDFNAYVTTCDILFAAYIDFQFHSNILTKAAAFSKPVVVSKGYVMERRTVDYGLGLAVPQSDAGAALAAVEMLLNAAAVIRPNRRDEYLRENSLEALDGVLAELLGTSRR